MGNRYTLFTDVRTFYEDLLAALPEAQSAISMMYFSFLHGEWTQRIAAALQERAAAGVRVRLMVDEVGMLTDRPVDGPESLLMLEELKAAGLQIDTRRVTG